jgi:hypothetical protein
VRRRIHACHSYEEEDACMSQSKMSFSSPLSSFI